MKQKLTLLLIALLSTIGAMAETYTITFDHRTGTFYRGGAVSTGWVNQWVSNEAGKPAVTITASANNINTDNGRMAPGSSTTCTYSISVESGYVVKGFSMNCPTFGAEVTVTPAGESAVVVPAGGTLVVNSSASSFVYSGSNSGRIQASAGDGGSFIITVEDGITVPTSIGDEEYVTVGEKVESITAATGADDNDHWYILTQVRGGESPMYDAGTGNQLKRTATSITPATISGSKANTSVQYLIRFFNAGDGLYNIQFANGNFITSSLTTSPYQQVAGKYAFYNTNGGSGSYFGWNLNSNTGSRVDNNGPTYTVAFWGSGTISGTSGNNVWYVYPAEVAAANVTYTYVISDESGIVFTSDALSGTAGETISTMPSNLERPYCTYNVTPTTLSVGENTVNVSVSYNPPFTVSASFDEATWYYATLRGKCLRADDNAKDGSGRYATNSTNERTDAYKWAFFGNPYTNFYVMNKAQGDGKYMCQAEQPTFQDVADPTANNAALWAVTPNSNGGFTLRSVSGGATWYINDAGGNGNLGFWNSGSGANDLGSNWLVTEVPAEVTVTYDLWVGGEKVNTKDVIATANSDVDIPASLTANYNSLAYDITYTGTIGTEDCTITVTATLIGGIVQPTALSNSKAYILFSRRDGLSTYYDEANSRTVLASPTKAALGVSAKQFAIINYKGNHYLYSISDEMFVTYQSEKIAPLAATVTGTSDAISFSQTTNSVYEIRFDNSASKILNSSGYYTYGVIINSWGANSSEWDDGCQYIICEAGDFNPSDALAALEAKFGPEAQFAEAIAALQAIDFGNELGKYGLTGEYAGYTTSANNIVDQLEAQGYSAEGLAMAQAMLANYAFNVPTAGKFYRFQSTHGTYLSGNLSTSTSSTGRLGYTDTADASTIFYFDGNKLYDLANGRAANGREVGTAGSEGITYWFEQSTITAGKYVIRFNPDGGSDRFLYAWGTDRNDADQNGSDHVNCTFTITEITTLPVTISAAGYATLYAPVALTIPSGITAYTGVINGEWLTTTKITGDKIPAETAVVLKAAAGSYDFDVTTAEALDVANDLKGSIGGKAAAGNMYVLANDADDGVGFYNATSGNVAGFKAYLEVGAGVKGFALKFDDDATAIESIQNSKFKIQNDEVIFNLAGQRIMKAQKGINIVNGKKVLK